jgi:virulence factor Mce-like protein
MADPATPRRRTVSMAANSVLVGAVTTLIVVVAVFLSYNANGGLPFVPTYDLKFSIPNAANLVVGNDVRMGGSRVGIVSDIEPQQHDNGAVTALVSLKLNTSVKPLPTDSTVLIRSRSALGLKYVEITRGTGSHNFEPGATVSLRQARPRPVELDQVLNTFDEATRSAIQRNTLEFGTGLAGRGSSLNEALANLPQFLRSLQPVASLLADPDTQLKRFFSELGRAAKIVAPAAETQAELFRNLNDTFGALASVARPYIGQSLERAPGALDAAIHSFPVQRPFLANTTGLLRELRPGVAALRTSAPILADALQSGRPTLLRLPIFNGRLESLLHVLDVFSTDPLVARGARQLAGTASALRPTAATLAPVQVLCNYATLWFRNVSSLLSEGDRNGTWQRFIIITTPQGPNAEGGPSSAPANGPLPDNHLHTNPYPNTGAPGEPRECEAGNEPYPVGKTVIGNAPGTQADHTERTTRGKP